MSLARLPFRPRALPDTIAPACCPLDPERRVQVLLAVLAIDHLRASGDPLAARQLLAQLSRSQIARTDSDGQRARLTLYGIRGAEGDTAGEVLAGWQQAARDRLAVS